MNRHSVQLAEVSTIDRCAASEAECVTLPSVGLNDIEGGSGNFTNAFRRRPERILAPRFRFNAQHVLYGRLRPYQNKVALPGFDGVCTTEIIPLLPTPGQIEPGFLHALLLSPHFVHWASLRATGSNLPRLDAGVLEEFSFTLPNLREQKRIVRTLQQANHLRRTRRYTLELSDTLLPAAFLELFGDPKTNPENWPIRYLSDLCEKFSDGPLGSNLKSEHYESSGVRVVRLNNIGIGEFIHDDEAFISSGHYQNLKKHECTTGDVLIGTLGEPHLRACIQPPSIRIAVNKADCVQARPNPAKASNQWMCWLLNMPSTLNLTPGLPHGQTRLRISMGQLANLPVPVPPIHIQYKFASLVERHERLRARQREALRQADYLFQTLLRRALVREIGSAQKEGGAAAEHFS